MSANKVSTKREELAVLLRILSKGFKTDIKQKRDLEQKALRLLNEIGGIGVLLEEVINNYPPILIPSKLVREIKSFGLESNEDLV